VPFLFDFVNQTSLKGKFKSNKKLPLVSGKLNLIFLRKIETKKSSSVQTLVKLTTNI